ncbi:hypothetical protein BECAL_03250 [Bellilinea caldifistulae]|uniref:Mannosylglycerate hydrolase MGH1-like glycoside hydrolase domain-containing protein n=1 Tax=Bellilinea caldifistulae TaxID=360411 RepID=A0A0P6X1P2_9CHLR|nr:hypothetical protein [Bellilinea caldifistulae]KPL76360.1 hypothetical protein AC812_06800 [Bellilinea caldifistulae]GAP12050.1 hypothetical protein BECAL_03250 [Bellilinea caldifistulae]
MNDPLMLTLCADARISPVDYLNDHIWQISFSGNEPEALTLFTTFGLRVRAMRLFPRFLRKDTVISAPADFFQPPRVTRLFPNDIEVRFSPFSGLDVTAEYRVFNSQAIGGRFTFHNPSVLGEKFIFEWCGLLTPLKDGEGGMRTTQFGIHPVLEGRIEGLAPVCFITGGLRAGSGPYPSLTEQVSLSPGGMRQIVWALASLPETSQSYELARQICARSWEADLARIELTNRSECMEITTGNPEWDAVFKLSQRLAASLFFPASAHLPRPSFVLARQPDQGYSLRGDGSDYNSLWNGATALDGWYLSRLVLPGMAERVAGVVENFLATADSRGQVDWKPGLAGQRSRRMAQPLLAQLAWDAHQTLVDTEWLKKVYTGLLAFFKAWFSPDHDRDQDGFPEWEHPYQSGLEFSPLFDVTFSPSQGIEPTFIETPALAAMLFNEAGCLLKIAAALGEESDQEWLKARQKHLRDLVEGLWNEEEGIYTPRDAYTHTVSRGEVLLTFDSPGEYRLQHRLNPPARLRLQLETQTELTRRIHLCLKGRDTFGNPLEEEITPQQISWRHGGGRYTSPSVFSFISSIEVVNLHPGDQATIATIDFFDEDISMLLPLWAGIPSPEHAARLVNETLRSRYLQPYGLVAHPVRGTKIGSGQNPPVLLAWNVLIGEGLIRYGYLREAVELFESWMKAITQSLRKEHVFRAAYDAMSGQGKGEQNVLGGAAPLGFFIRLLGVRLLGDQRIILTHLNPFSFPVTVQYRRITLTFLSDSTRITLPNGQTWVYDGNSPQEIWLTPPHP